MRENMKTELLSPAGSYDSFRAGLNAGADAFYLGGSRFGARAYADNFTEDVLLKTIDEAHIFGKKIYLTVNTLFKENEAEELYDYLLPYYRAGLDAVIVQDTGILKLVKEYFPQMHIHASTQMTVTGADGAKLLEDFGVKRVVPARELSLKEIKEIREKTSLEIECFVHGALCYCYSGQCLMSSFIGGRSGNRGRCAQPCRMPYSVCEKGKLISNEGSAYALNTKDICMADNVAELIEAGIGSFKIEGRMKRPEYTAGVVSVYRKYIDLYEENRDRIKAENSDRALLADLFNRDGFSRSYYFQHNGRDMMALKNAKTSVSRTKKADEAYAFVKKEIIENEIKKKVTGRFVITDDMKAHLTVSDGAVSAEAVFDGVQESLNRPLDEETVLKQLDRTGGTQYIFERIETELPQNAFMTMKQLNELRRSAFESFSEKLTGRYRREAEQRRPVFDNKKGTGRSDSEIRVSVLTKEQLEWVKNIKGVDGFYLPIALCMNEMKPEELDALKDRMYIALPYISRSTRNRSYRKHMIKLAEKGFGFLVRSLEDAAFLIQNGYADRIRLDYTLYTMNSKSREFWRTMGVHEDTVPVELNRREISQRDNSLSEMIIYGRIPLMISAQCIRKNYGTCDHSFGGMILKDRKNAEFPVCFECGQCYNIIYNSVPVSLLSAADQAKTVNADCFRVILTSENKKDAVKTVSDAVSAIKEGRVCKETFEFTRGHFNRGIE